MPKPLTPCAHLVASHPESALGRTFASSSVCYRTAMGRDARRCHFCRRVSSANLDAAQIWVCPACAHVPVCQICGLQAAVEGQVSGWVGFRFSGYCPECVGRVRKDGPWKKRRAAATAARRDALLLRFPALVVTKETETMTRLAGTVFDRSVQIRLRRGARSFEYERHIFHVELREDHERGPVQLPSPVVADAARMSAPKITSDRGRWLRVACLHLGKVDTVEAVASIVAAAVALDESFAP